MNDGPSGVTQSKSGTIYNYATIKITQSRIDKGLIAIPVALTKWFPENSGTIRVYLNDSSILQIKNYSSYDSSTRECRIGGMREWFEEQNIKDGDEIVIQFIDPKHSIYRLITEQTFILKTRELQFGLDNSSTEEEALEKIKKISRWTHSKEENVLLNEYYRLSDTLSFKVRRYARRNFRRAAENVPASLRLLLGNIYDGHCQVCDFWFLKKNKKPYFEIHHIDPLRGHHPKNLLLVCGNCHNQFEYADINLEFDYSGWLTRVSFNEKVYPVNQIILSSKVETPIKEIFTV